MSFSFNPREGLILVQAELWGPSGSGIVSLALDTGATSTVVNQSRLMQVGYDPALVPDRLQITTGSGVEFVPRLTLSKVTALGQERTSFPVLCHTLPPSAGVDGLLGLDFFRGQTLTVDFRSGEITLS
jgi:predicted aspartyl protease